jgi:hypothetical protein
LEQAFSIWKKASGYTERRNAIRERCIRLTKLLGSLRNSLVLSHFQDAKGIQQDSQTFPDDKLPQVEQDLMGLENRLRATDAEDGKKILNPERYKKFILDDDSE